MTEKEKLDNLINSLRLTLRKAFLSAIQNITDNVIISQLVRMIEVQDIEGAFATLGLSPAALRPITAAIEQAYEQGGIFTFQTFPKYLVTPIGKAVFHFDVRNTHAEQWIKNESSSLVSNIIEPVRTNIRDLMTVGLEKGINPRSTAMSIIGAYDPVSKQRQGGIIGLTTSQEGWVRSARNKLETLNPSYFDMELRDKRFDPTVARAIADNKPLDRDTIDKLTLRYRDGALKYRGETISRTETLSALSASDYEATRQVIALGAIKASGVFIEWDDVGDKRVRHTHRKMNGQRVLFGEPFKSPSGALMLHPHDTSLGAPASEIVDCRCRTKKAIDWLSGGLD